jgi:hypothetical protein
MPVIFTFIQSPRGRLRWNTLIIVLFTCTTDRVVTHVERYVNVRNSIAYGTVGATAPRYV